MNLFKKQVKTKKSKKPAAWLHPETIIVTPTDVSPTTAKIDDQAVVSPPKPASIRLVQKESRISHFRKRIFDTFSHFWRYKLVKYLP